MWISKELWQAAQRLAMEAVETRGARAVLEQRIIAMDTTMDWLRVRVNQLELERAQMIYNYTGVKVPTPQVKREDPTDQEQLLAAASGFEDIGDEMAKKLGIGWNEFGEMTTTR